MTASRLCHPLRVLRPSSPSPCLLSGLIAATSPWTTPIQSIAGAPGSAHSSAPGKATITTSASRIASSNPESVTLRHIHLYGPPDSPGRLVPYASAASFQESLRERLLKWKRDTSSHTPAPLPTVVTFVPLPTYTLGRRESVISREQESRLRRPLRVRLWSGSSNESDDRRKSEGDVLAVDLHPNVLPSDRGGLTTYHGPGQLVVWPVFDLKSPHHAHLTVRSYARLLEATTQDFLRERFGLGTYLNEEEPGVWASQGASDAIRGGGVGTGPEKKIAAMGIYLRRHVTGLGVAVNVDVPVQGGEEINPWARFVPCGLEGKSVTSIAAQRSESWPRNMPLDPTVLESIGQSWARQLAMNVRGIAGVEHSNYQL